MVLNKYFIYRDIKMHVVNRGYTHHLTLKKVDI